MHTMIIGIAGGTGSGKTTLTDHLAAHFGPAISVVHHDNYYKRQDVPFEVRCPVYSYADHNRTDETVLIRPAPVIIVEGILIFHDPRLRQLMDIRIFVETDADVRILRRALRDVEERGRSMQSIVQQYLTTVKPMHEQFVEPTRKYADIVVLEGGHNLVALDLIMQRIAGHIAENPPEDAT